MMRFYTYLTPSELVLNSPQPRRGGQEMRVVRIQIEMTVATVDMGVDRGN